MDEGTGDDDLDNTGEGEDKIGESDEGIVKGEGEENLDSEEEVKEEEVKEEVEETPDDV